MDADPFAGQALIGSPNDPGGSLFGSGAHGPFVFDYNSYLHIKMVLLAGGRFRLAAGVAWVDFWHGSQGTDAIHTNWHAMGGGLGSQDAVGAYAGGNQKCGEAYAGTEGTERGDDQGTCW